MRDPHRPEALPPLDLDRWRGRARPDRDWTIGPQDVWDGLACLVTLGAILGLWRAAS